MNFTAATNFLPVRSVELGIKFLFTKTGAPLPIPRPIFLPPPTDLTSEEPSTLISSKPISHTMIPNQKDSHTANVATPILQPTQNQPDLPYAEVISLQQMREKEQAEVKAIAAKSINQLRSGELPSPAVQKTIVFFAEQGDLELSHAFAEKIHFSEPRKHVLHGSVSQYSHATGNHACGPISALAAMKMLKGTLISSDDLDKAVRDGVRVYQDVLEGTKTALGLDNLTALVELIGPDLSIDAIFGEHSPLTQKLVEEGLERGGQHTISLSKDIPPSRTYQELLRPLCESDSRCFKTGIVTLAPETMVIGYNPITKLWSYFNSHGNDLALSNMDFQGPGILATFSSLGELTDYLASKKFWIDPSQAANPDINNCALYLIQIRE